MLGLGRLKARLSRWWRKVDIDLWWRHCASLAEVRHTLIQRWEGLRTRARISAHSLLRVLVVHGRVEAKGTRLELWECLLLLRNQARGDMRAVARADVRISFIEIKLSKLHHGVMEQLGIILRIEERRGLVRIETVLLR